MKSSLPIKWLRPEKIPCYKPEKSGDLAPLEEIDKKRLALEFQDCKELEMANEHVKKLFTLEFLPYEKTVESLRKDYMDKVRRHNLDTQSPEARLAKMTADIRDMQRRLEEFPLDKHTKVRLKETIDKRKRHLKRMRELDYKCFEWALEQLDLVYKPFPPKTVYQRIERKRSLRALTQEYCDNMVQGRLNEYRESLKAQQEGFLEEKLQKLKWIMKEEEECQLAPSVSEADIRAVEEELKAWREKNKKEETIVSES